MEKDEVVYLDSNVFIFAALDNGDTGKKCRDLIEKIRTGRRKAATSALTFDEVVWKIKNEIGKEQSLIIGRAILTMGHLSILDVNTEILFESSNLIEEYNLDPRDAIHLACLKNNNIRTIISNDSDFDKVDKIKRIEL